MPADNEPITTTLAMSDYRSLSTQAETEMLMTEVGTMSFTAVHTGKSVAFYF